MAHKVVFRAAAAADLTALYDYIASDSSPEIAIGYVRRIQEACLGLATFPERAIAATIFCRGCAWSVLSAR